ncbi:hypothetical protein PDR5_10890 [Pseudomonas sp. DR 5-09]|nr:hypothetical protein PDR5_10890 [Pseudomonas sp. DR 5-09]
MSLPTLRMANTPEIAGEVYVPSVMIGMERWYLDELARHLSWGRG